MNDTLHKILLITVVLSIFQALVGESLIYAAYFNDQGFLDQTNKVMAALIIFYVIPVVFLFKLKFLYVLLGLIVLTPLFSILFLILCGMLFPIMDENPGLGILVILILSINLVSVGIGTIIGVFIHVLLYYKRKIIA
ncbi:hypothetical protein [Paenibacillus sp. FJAT-26967]|uniref:hypothetical protein n=1 Tax=Paenibacillus sp. FJAT-26967 TaxID=1729690 RepID=UPI0008390B2A|nr:hypothetical protein [Paenibacillus sp. FJAT-26967]